jgi:hypothetical protein
MKERFDGYHRLVFLGARRDLKFQSPYRSPEENTAYEIIDQIHSTIMIMYRNGIPNVDEHQMGGWMSDAIDGLPGSVLMYISSQSNPSVLPVLEKNPMLGCVRKLDTEEQCTKVAELVGGMGKGK